MKTVAIVIVEPGRVEARDVELPPLAPHEILSRTLVSGISVGTERHYITGVYADMGQDVSTHYPFATGYQRCAVVEQVGDAVESLRPGDQIITGRCCFADPTLHGSGGHVSLGVTDAAHAYRLAPDVDPEEAALWVMAGVGLHGARLSQIAAGETVAVIGLGMIGQMAAQAARRRGATVYAADRDERRAELGRHSADEVFQGTADEFADYLLSRFPNGVDVVADTGSKVAVWDTCERMVRREGRINLQGYYPGAFQIDSYRAHVRRVSAFFPSGYDDPNGIAANLGPEGFTIKPLITHRFRADEINTAYDLVIRSPHEIVGGVIDWR